MTATHATKKSPLVVTDLVGAPAASQTESLAAMGDARSVQHVLARPLAEVDAYLDGFVCSLAVPENLRDAIRYALLGGGKRLRPVIAWYAAEAVGGRGEESLPAGAAVELVHAFSLVHDDLPAMDDDDLRRGRPTLHRAFNEAMAILAGDAKLTFAFAVLVERVRRAELATQLVAELATGTAGMIAGQVYDTLGGMDDALPGEAKLKLIHKNKTGALIRSSARMGAMLALAAEPEVEVREARLAHISTYADAIGLMFQIVDDILDVTQTTEQLGKKTNKDHSAGKLTYPGVLGLEAANARVDELLAEALEAISEFGAAAEPLRLLARYMAVRTK